MKVGNVSSSLQKIFMCKVPFYAPCGSNPLWDSPLLCAWVGVIMDFTMDKRPEIPSTSSPKSWLTAMWEDLSETFDEHKYLTNTQHRVNSSSSHKQYWYQLCNFTFFRLQLSMCKSPNSFLLVSPLVQFPWVCHTFIE